MYDRDAEFPNDQVPEEDAFEQAQALVEQDDPDPQRSLDIPAEADLADVAEQTTPVSRDPYDDEDREY